MDINSLQQLLIEDEGATLEFKREPYKIDYGEGKTRQKGELAKDILSLANGNSIVAGETAYLIIGVDDNLNLDGTRNLYDVGECDLSGERLRRIVNNVCEPAIENIQSEILEIAGKRLIAITIFPSPYLHETTKELETPHHTYTQCTVFVRHNSEIEIASSKERDAIIKLKQIRLAESRKAYPIPFGAAIGSVIGGVLVSSTAEKVSEGKAGKTVGWIAGILMGSFIGGLMGNMYRDIIEIKSNWARVSARRKVGAFFVATAITPGLWFLFDKTAKWIRERVKRG